MNICAKCRPTALNLLSKFCRFPSISLNALISDGFDEHLRLKC
jgi:hypothetical protein